MRVGKHANEPAYRAKAFQSWIKISNEEVKRGSRPPKPLFMTESIPEIWGACTNLNEDLGTLSSVSTTQGTAMNRSHLSTEDEGESRLLLGLGYAMGTTLLLIFGHQIARYQSQPPLVVTIVERTDEGTI